MDERNKVIRDLEEKRRQDLAASDETLEKLGRRLLADLEVRKTKEKPKKNQDASDEGKAEGRAQEASGGTDNAPAVAITEYRCSLADIADCESQIKDVEKESSNYQELIENIVSKENDYSKDSKELSTLYVQIGRLALSDAAFDTFSAQYQDQTEGLLANIETREARLEELEQKTGSFFSFIGKSAEGLVVKTLLLKNQADLQKIYRSAGEKFIITSEDYEDGSVELKEVAGAAGQLKASLAELASELALLKEERKKTTDRFRGDGNPDRRIKALEKQIARDRDEITVICRRFGGFTLDKAHADYFNPILGEDDRKDIARVEMLLASVAESSVRIGKLKAAVAIDGEKETIEKFKKSIDSEKRKIKAAEEAIAGMEKDIQSAENRIEELKKLI